MSATVSGSALHTGPTRWTRWASPLGAITLAGTDAGLTRVQLAGQRHAAEPDLGWTADSAPFADAVAQLEAYFTGERRRFALPLAPAGTAFQRAVWQQLAEIPFGSTISYGTLAERVGNPKAVRAVGLAVGRNPLAVVVPCHRVIGARGALTGYAGGVERKRWLLDHEARVAGSALPAG